MASALSSVASSHISPIERQRLTQEPDGSILWQAPIAEWREMLPWIRGWGSSVEVLEPAKLRHTSCGIYFDPTE